MLIKRKKSKIITQTRKKKRIPNYQGCTLSTMYKRQLHLLITRKYRNARFRSAPTNVYNCHGLVFASRRTGIHKPEVVKKIIDEDEYKLIRNPEYVKPGDIILYHSASGDIEHSGIIIEMPKTPPWVPLIWSKWGMYGEAVHRANHCEYNFANVMYYRIIE